MKNLLTIIFLLIVGFGFAQPSLQITDANVEGGSYLGYRYVHVIPANIEECLVALSCHPPGVLDDFASYSLESALEKGLFNANNRLRMNWKLEIEQNPLRYYFHSKKVYHHKTMETVILWMLHNDLRNDQMTLKKVIRKSKRKHRKEEKRAKKRLRSAYKQFKNEQKEMLEEEPEEQERTPPPKSFKEWIYTY